jgi:hypothetical protein
MKENYINIFTSFLAGLLEKGQISLEDVGGLVKVFEPISPMVQSRKQLATFLGKYTEVYPQLEELKKQLLDDNYQFNITK